MSKQSGDDYFPAPDGAEWERVAPERAGIDPERLAKAVELAERAETSWPIDVKAHIEAGYFEPPPDNAILGPTRSRGGPNGMVLRGGRIVASWGDTRRVDMTFSVAKSYLSVLAGIAVADGLISDLDEPVGRTIEDGGFDGDHNSKITWRHLLQQTSEWEGTMWDKSDQIDRNRVVSYDGQRSDKGKPRRLAAAGDHWEYNDVRVNRLSLALLRRFKRSLPEVFAERIVGPIGGSSEWGWEGYRNSYVEIDGCMVQSVPGGSHWGGGVFIHSEDQARIALLMLRRGRWGSRSILPETWIDQSFTPCRLNPAYGFLWWLNTSRQRYPAASEESVFALGTGGHICWIDPRTDVVAVLRWVDTDQVNNFIGDVTAAIL